MTPPRAVDSPAGRMQIVGYNALRHSQRFGAAGAAAAWPSAQRITVRKVMPPRMKPGAFEMVTGQSRPFLKSA